MRPLVWLCVLSSAAAPLAQADETSKAAKIAELLQLTGERQFLHEVDGKLDQEAAVRMWGRAYAENVTEAELDAILAYYRSPAGQKDVSASRAALAQVKRKQPPAVSAAAPSAVAAVASSAGMPRAPAPPIGDVGSTAALHGSAGGDVESTAAAPRAPGNDVGSTAAARHASGTASDRPWDSPPRAPDGLIVPSPSSPEHCEAPPTSPAGKRAGGRSVVCVCTDEKGALTRDPIIAESSGDPRVDSGAIKMARIDSGRYIPPTLNGQPQTACFRFAIDFSHHP